MGRTALLACPEGGTSLSAMAGLDRSSFNTEPGLRSISFSIFCFCAVCCCRQLFLLQGKRPRPLSHRYAMPALPKGEPLAKPDTLRFDRKLFRHAKASPFGRGGCEHREQTERASPLTEIQPRYILFLTQKEPLHAILCNGSFSDRFHSVPACA